MKTIQIQALRACLAMHNDCICIFKSLLLMLPFKRPSKYFLFFSLVLLLLSCNRGNTNVSYRIVNEETNIKRTLLEWSVTNPIPKDVANHYIDNYIKEPLPTFIAINTPKIDDVKWFRYKASQGLVDFKEFYSISPSDTTLCMKDSCALLSCILNTDTPKNLFLEVKSECPISFFLNGVELKRMDVQGLKIYPLKIKEGNNLLMSEVEFGITDLSLETTLYDSLSICDLYTEGQSGNLIYPLISRHTKRIMLTNNHQEIVSSPVSMLFIDANGKVVHSECLRKDSMTYIIPELEPNISYTCQMQIGNCTVRQSVCCGNGDDSYIRFKAMRAEIDDNHPRAKEIDQILYRLNFLLNHPSKNEGDWWWQFKIAPLTYQLEHIFAHLDETYGCRNDEPNIKFITYRSNLDGGNQRYLIATPNKHRGTKPLPLVVVIRPNIENHWHFFSCPQIARQWAINQMQALANKYNYLVMMPEMRTYLDEDMVPFAEAELKLAIEDVEMHYDIDKKRMFLHANCSGAYRALSFATKNPQMFAAIALYAPMYEKEYADSWSKENAPKNNIANLKDIPLFIHCDPIDRHSPPAMYAELINDAHRIGMPLTMSIKRNSGKYYNIVLVGEEAFDFFKDKKKDVKSKRVGSKRKTARTVIADFYSEPFIYVYNSANKSERYINLLNQIKADYEDYLFTKLPIVADIELAHSDLETKNILFIGTEFVNKEVMRIINKVKINSVDTAHECKSNNYYIYDNPVNDRRKIIICKAEENINDKHPWMMTKSNYSDYVDGVWK